MNWLTDMDAGWWPVVFLRPAKNKEIGNVLLLKMSGVFGTAVGLLVFLWFFIKPNRAVFSGLLAFGVMFGYILFFLFYKFTFAYFWNRRAKRLSDGEIRPGRPTP